VQKALLRIAKVVLIVTSPGYTAIMVMQASSAQAALKLRFINAN
jgi:hypothetical protein